MLIFTKIKVSVLLAHIVDFSTNFKTFYLVLRLYALDKFRGKRKIWWVLLEYIIVVLRV